VVPIELCLMPAWMQWVLAWLLGWLTLASYNYFIEVVKYKLLIVHSCFVIKKLNRSQQKKSQKQL
jgi:hypothetical protein